MLKLSFKKDSWLRKTGFLLLVSLDIIILGIFFLSLFAVGYEEGKAVLIRIIREEQNEHKESLDELTASCFVQVEELKNDLEILKKRRWLTLKEKSELQDKLEKLEKTSLELQLEYIDYHNDISIGMCPWRDRKIDDIYGRSWVLPMEINRFIRSYENVIFRGYLGAEQDEIISNNAHAIGWQLENLK